MLKLDTQAQTHNEPLNGSLNSSNVSSASTTTTTSSETAVNANINSGGDANNNYIIIKKSTSHDSFVLNDNEHDSSNLDFSSMSRTNLIVNYLPQNMTQDEIKELFASIGQVESCKLIKDKLTGQSLGYAFVNFVNPDDADKAIANFNGMKLQNKTIKVSLARPSSDQIKGANLYICGLPKTFAQSDLERMFSEFGTIISSKILTDPNTSNWDMTLKGESKGVGFVRFDKRYEAERAIEKLNGKTYENIAEPLVVKFANSPTSVKSGMGNGNGGLPLAPFIPTVRGFYQPYRSSTNASYRYSPMSGSATTGASASVSAYCQQTDSLIHHQSPAIAALNGLTAVANSLPATPTLGTTASTTGTPSTVGLITATSPPHSLSTNSLSSINYSGWPIFVYNLGPESDESLLWQLFGPFGAVQSVKIIRDMQTHKCKGFGFVTMTNYEEAITAINCLNGLNLQNRILQVSFKTNNKHVY